MKTQDQVALRMYVRAREDFQDMRKRMDNRLGRKADGKTQNLKEERIFAPQDLENFNTISMESRRNEKEVEKMLKQGLKRFPIYTEWLANVKGVGDIIAGHLLGNFDITIATAVSKMWQYAGLNPSLVRGKVRIEVAKYREEMGPIVSIISGDDGKPKDYIYQSDDLIRGDKATPGYVLPYNKALRTALIGILAPGFIKYVKTCDACKAMEKETRPALNCHCERSHYAIQYYYPYKARLEQERNPINSLGNKDDGKAWGDVSKGHRDNAAKRYMIKIFLQDFYVAWRTLEGLPVREPYAEEYLGKTHTG
jgi:hypothetical protein